MHKITRNRLSGI